MKTINRMLLAIALMAASMSVQAVAYNVDKSPDQGPFWQPISTSSTYVYASDFIAPDDGAPTTLGTWLLEFRTGGVPNVRFEIWADNDGNGPDPGAVLMTTGSVDVSGSITDQLQYFEFPVSSIIEPLQRDERYWFVITVVGETAADGAFQTGGHTENSVCLDNGTFWYSNDSNGINFDGQGRSPQMAFVVEVDGGGPDDCGEEGGPLAEVPVPTMGRGGLIVLALMLALFGGLGVRYRMG